MPRLAARAVIVDDRGYTAILRVRGGDYFKIPGGKIDPGESPMAAAEREAREEAGCGIEIIGMIGDHTFVDPTDEAPGEVNYSICYFARKKEEVGTEFTDEEAANGFECVWLPFDDALQAFRGARPTDPMEQIMNARDLAFLERAWSRFGAILRQIDEG